MEIDFPIEFVVRGTPVSLQTKRRATMDDWRSRIRQASYEVLPEGHFASDGRIAVTIYYFPATQMQGDIDNIVKPVLDALCRHVYLDDRQVERVVVQKFEPNRFATFASSSNILRAAVEDVKPIVYISISDDPREFV